MRWASRLKTKIPGGHPGDFDLEQRDWVGVRLRRAVSGYQPGLTDYAFAGGGTQARRFKIRPGLFGATAAGLLDVQTVALRKRHGNAGFNVRGKTGKHRERGGDERSNSHGGKCLDHDGPLSWAPQRARLRCGLSNQESFRDVFSKAENGFVPRRLCFVPADRTKHWLAA